MFSITCASSPQSTGFADIKLRAEATDERKDEATSQATSHAAIRDFAIFTKASPCTDNPNALSTRLAAEASATALRKRSIKSLVAADSQKTKSWHNEMSCSISASTE